MPTYKTPGVFVEEKSTLPPSVAEVSTAVPAFIGFTERRPPSTVARINTLLEYEEFFGGPRLTPFTLNTDLSGNPVVSSRGNKGASADPDFLLYYQISHYFKNGGGTCYVVSVGDYSTSLSKKAFEDGLARLALEDEPTLILLSDAVNLSKVDYYDLCQAALRQCHDLGDRFAVFDVRRNSAAEGDDVAELRSGVGQNYLAYGAAYYPYLETTFNYAYKESEVTMVSAFRREILPKSITVAFDGIDDKIPSVAVLQDETLNSGEVSFAVKDMERTLTIKYKDAQTGAKIVEKWNAWKSITGNNAGGFIIAQSGDGSGLLTAFSEKVFLGAQTKLSAIQTTDTALYNRAKAFLVTQRVTLPPSGAIAGIYASTDRDRGVWKAPANVSVSAVIGPVTKISDDTQNGLNVDADTGKSINAIRAFSGKGTLVWGARTLAGNDNEWRYISVRRLFIMIEESARKSTAFAVFEPNDLTTWLKVKGMIDSFLYGLWERGALAGSKPDQAYFVNVGLGKTMTPQDILEGRMIVEIGIAAVRPAEFIILRFSHKLQEA